MTDQPPHTRSLRDKLLRYRGEIDNALYKAEIACEQGHNGRIQCPLGSECSFHAAHKKNRPYGCEVVGLREVMGEHVEHHDIPQCDTEEK